MLKKCFGIISWLPNDKENRILREERLNRLLKQLSELMPEIDILIIAQNWGDFIPVNTNNNKIIKNYPPLGILGARKTLRKEFLNLNYDYIIMFDDDAIIQYANLNLIKQYLQLIDNNPKGFAFVRGTNNAYNPYAGAHLNLCAISRYIYEREDMVDLDPQKGEGFEDCVFATLLHHKYSNLEWNIPDGLKCIQFRIKGEKAKSTWWDECKHKSGLLQRTNAVCKYISENKKLPENLSDFISNVNSNKKIHIVSRKTILNTEATFTGLPEEYWKDNF